MSLSRLFNEVDCVGHVTRWIATAVMLFVSVQVSAELIERDLFSAGDGIITFDSNTGYEWLDLAPTLGLSYNEALATSFVTELGFRHATFDELVELYAGVSIFNLDGSLIGGRAADPFHSTSVENLVGVGTLLDRFGCVGQCSVGEPFGQGWVDIGVADRTSYSFFQGIVGADGEVQINSLAGTHTKNSAHFETSSFLVRSAAPVPEPETGALMLAGLGVMAWVAKRRKRKPAAT